jgi:hypothetical protein
MESDLVGDTAELLECKNREILIGRTVNTEVQKRKVKRNWKYEKSPDGSNVYFV